MSSSSSSSSLPPPPPTSPLIIPPPTLTCTFIAHVDHGKTTLCDHLLSFYHSSLSPTSVGEARVMDNTDEEVRRGITIKAGFMCVETDEWIEGEDGGRCRIGVMDSPGHVDFQSEVSDSLHLSSLGLLLIDASEGVLCRTVGVLRILSSRPLSVMVNKMDRIDKDEWDEKVRRIVENVSAVRAGLQKDEDGNAMVKGGGGIKGIEVMVGSAREGWGASLVGLTGRIWSFLNKGKGKASIKEVRRMSRMILEGNVGVRFDWDKGEVKVVKKNSKGSAEEGWNLVKDIYQKCEEVGGECEGLTSKEVAERCKGTFPFLMNEDEEGGWIKKWCRVNGRVRNWEGGKIMSLVCPLGREIVKGVIRTGMGVETITGGNEIKAEKEKREEGGEEGWIMCGRTRIEASGAGKKLVTICKVYGGHVTREGEWWLFKDAQSTKSEAVEGKDYEVITITSITVVEKGVKHRVVDRVEDGGVCILETKGSIEWDEGWIKDNAVLTYGALVRPSSAGTPHPSASSSATTRAITFTISPVSERDRSGFERGVERIHRLEIGAQVRTTDRGEVTVSVGGEVEMENLVHDLKTLYMDGVAVKVGERLVEGRESVGGNARHSADGYEISKRISGLLERGDKWGMLDSGWYDYEGQEAKMEIPLFRAMRDSLICQGHYVTGGYARISYQEGELVFGVYPAPDGDISKITFSEVLMQSGSNYLLSKVPLSNTVDLRPLIISAFNAFVNAGPVTEEPLHRVAVILHRASITSEVEEVWGGDRVGVITQALRACCLERRTRIFEPYCLCEFQSTLNSSSHAYAVISKRRGKVKGEEIIDGTDLIGIQAVIPMAEIGGITKELLERSSGEATPPIVEFNHWGECDGDPFWYPKKKEEREEFGEGGKMKMGDNISGRIVRKTRRRKGLKAVYEEEKIVVEAEKLRNLKQKK